MNIQLPYMVPMRALLLSLLLPLAACSCGGHYARSGACEGWNTDTAACERAAKSRSALERVKLGQSEEEVRAIMGPPEGREAAGTGESWSYLTDYDGGRNTVIVLESGIVTAIRQNHQ